MELKFMITISLEERGGDSSFPRGIWSILPVMIIIASFCLEQDVVISKLATNDYDYE